MRALLVLLLLALSQQSAAQDLPEGDLPEGYLVKGWFSGTWYRASGTTPEDVRELQNYRFEVRVFGDTWRVQTWWDRFPQQSDDVYFDGKTVVKVHHNHKVTSRMTTTVVSESGFPADNYPLNIPWLAFASQRYLKAENYLPAPWARNRTVDALVYEPHVTMQPIPPYLPTEIDFRLTLKRVRSALENPLFAFESRFGNEESILSRHAQSINDGLIADGEVAAEYSVTSLTNAFGFALPKEFSLKVYGVGDASKPVRLMFAGAVDSVQPQTSPLEPPDASVPLQVGDYRFRDDSLQICKISYVQSNQMIRAVSDPALVKLFEDKQERVREHFRANSPAVPNPWPIRLLVFALVLVPPAAWFFFRSKGQQS